MRHDRLEDTNTYLYERLGHYRAAEPPLCREYFHRPCPPISAFHKT